MSAFHGEMYSVFVMLSLLMTVMMTLMVVEEVG